MSDGMTIWEIRATSLSRKDPQGVLKDLDRLDMLGTNCWEPFAVESLGNGMTLIWLKRPVGQRAEGNPPVPINTRALGPNGEDEKP